jgi:hypothetical protein
MAQLNESKLRQIIKEEIKSLLKENRMISVDQELLYLVKGKLEQGVGTLHWCKDAQKLPNDAAGQAAKEACKLVNIMTSSANELHQAILKSRQKPTG